MIERGRSSFLQRGKVWFYVSPEGTLHRITKISIIANGTNDLCIVKGCKQGNDTVKKIVEADKDRILYVPLEDVLWINIFPPYKGANSIILDIGYDKEHMKTFVMAMLKSFGAKPSDRGDQYDTHFGDNYWNDS